MIPETVGITRKFNLGNYQTMDIHVEGSILPTENAVQALKDLEQIIMDFWQGRRDNLLKMAGKEQ